MQAAERHSQSAPAQPNAPCTQHPTCVLMASARGCIVPEMPARNSGCTASAAPMRSSAAPSARHSELCGGCINTGAQASSPVEICKKRRVWKG